MSSGYSLDDPFSNSVNVCVEALPENQIQEILFDGQEITQPPLTLSETLAKLAHKIDWSKSGTETLESTASAKEDETAGKAATFQAPTWPWENFRNKLRSAMTEICVLQDVISIAKEKRYMVLDPVVQDQQEPRLLAHLLAKKRGLAASANILISGAERLKAFQADSTHMRNNQDFYMELLKLRQSWRLKKVGNVILGDLSYRSAGSRFHQSGIFEVTKAEESGSAETPDAIATLPKTPSTIKVIIPSELEGNAYIQVTIQKDQDILCQSNMSLLAPSLAPSGISQDVPWQRKLETAQNVLFCKELFAHLAREAVQLQAAIPHMVVGNQITASLFPGIQMVISLVHSTGADKRNASSTSATSGKPDHNYILEHSLHQLLRQVHLENIAQPIPHPSSAPLGPSKRRRLAGPQAYDRHELLQMATSKKILQQIVQQGQHVVLRLRTMFVIDSLARDIRDPLIVSHWNVLNSPTLSCVKIIIMTHGYDTLHRTAIVVHVGEKTLKCVCRDGRVFHLSYEPQELRDLILCQISQHQVNTVQSLARFLGWQVLSSATHLGVGPVEPLGNASSCLLASPSGTQLLVLRYGPQAVQPLVFHACPQDAQPQVFHASFGKKTEAAADDEDGSSLLRDKRWEQLKASFEEVHLDKIEGRNFLSRMELLMASLTGP